LKTIYISGQMTGVAEYNFPEFNRVATLLRAKGFNVLNPAEHGCSPEYTWSDYMRMDIADLINSDIVATLPSWEKSKGANLEVYIAKQLGMPVVDYSELIESL
jgi:hypothetical protein